MAFSVNAQSTLKGDVNGDGEVNVTDVTMIVEHVMGQHNSNFIVANADVNSDGGITVTDVAEAVNTILAGHSDNPQDYLPCPDGNHPHMIDLGLPSGTKWACCNVGANKPEAFGGYYAWGETADKDVYSWNTYIHCDGDWDSCHDLGNDIAGTQFDVAHVKWGGSWKMPSQDQNSELFEKCTYEWTTRNGVEGGKFTGPNGATIFLPAAGYRLRDYLHNTGKYGHYWPSTQHPSYRENAYFLYFNSGNAHWSSYPRSFASTVRPVSK